MKRHLMIWMILKSHDTDPDKKRPNFVTLLAVCNAYWTSTVTLLSVTKRYNFENEERYL
jgi:hypothetical protein